MSGVYDYGVAEGANKRSIEVATDMLAEKLPISMIERISKLSADAIRAIAKAKNLAVVEA